ncbi:MAG: acyltransferase [Pseudonocardiaceae bacterium]|nr:acyltransferase [Pseudonocardiaceae bacterium]
MAIAGIVSGHWLVTATVAAPGGTLAGLDVDSPLRHLPELVPVSWLLQTLGLFFFAGGFAAAVSHARGRLRGERPASWFGARVRRLAVAVAVVLLGWVAVWIVLSGFGLSAGTAATVRNLVTSPLWFLAVYVVLLAGTSWTRSLHARFGVGAAAIPGFLAVGVDAAVALGAPEPIGQLNVLLVWWVLWQLGVAVADGWTASWRHGAVLLVCAAAGFGILVLVAGYPASAVGGTGEARSNLAPPSVAALALALAQLGGVLIAAPLLRRLAAMRGWRAAIGWANVKALPIFLLHQSALVTVVLIAGSFGALPGLHTPPDDLGWVAARLCWLPVFAGALVVLLAVLGRLLGGPPRRPLL